MLCRDSQAASLWIVFEVISCSLPMSFSSGSRLVKPAAENVRPAEAVGLHLRPYGEPGAYLGTPKGFALGEANGLVRTGGGHAPAERARSRGMDRRAPDGERRSSDGAEDGCQIMIN
ncbi:hypothetical protein Plo01_10950 [Planobispora longispora]|uniref:Uncharacterized protein n=1 Tax=Planobispora longispora TaxID=28887 RepID=A0A8J3REB2_9ACTN|nr:hypothetical protein GCM10020093_095900 [Planobispora longispora]GIH74666.1 hypothetical protein Plo01_10950 [Planobispora longispora]